MSDDPRLQSHRDEIDAIDQQLQDLINKRVALAREIASLKSKHQQPTFYRPEREARILQNVLARNTGPLPGAEMARLFREIMSASLAAEQLLKIAVLGPQGTYTQTAALKHFGGSAETVTTATIGDVFHAVESDQAGFGVVPIENSTEGVIAESMNRLVDTPLRVCGEIELRIQHCLLSHAENIHVVETVLAHGQALAQCRDWLRRQMPHAELKTANSNAEAAKQAAADKSVAAIAGAGNAELYGLPILARQIEDVAGNTTRFLVIGKLDCGPSGNDKTSLLVSVKNKPGALFHLLEPLARHGVNMTRIESRPSRAGLWEYVFFVDVEGHVTEPKLVTALADLELEAAVCKVLGSYPKAVL